MPGFAAGNGALVKCSFGVAPTPLTFLPLSMMMTPTGPIGSCVDFIPFLNVKPFGVCMSMANPMTAALTAAALGVFTPAPCIPIPLGPWMPSTTAMGMVGPILTASSCLNCMWGGCINILMPAQFMVQG